MRATWVETTRSVGAWKLPTLSAREWRSATLATLGANGSCTWQMSSAAAVEQLLDRARDVERDGGPGARAARQRRQRLADGEHPRAAVVGQQLAGVDGPPALAHEVLRARRRDDQDAVPTGGELVADAANLLVDLVPRLPRVRGDVGDGVRPGHRRAA